MTDLALRRQIAEARGWTSIHISGKHTIGGVPPFDYIGSFLTIPPYDTDIAAAWELLEGKMYRIETTYGEDIVVSISLPNRPRNVTGRSATAPAAICKAWLKYKEQHDRFN